jgi:predicted adenylyl cyclase CyaB
MENNGGRLLDNLEKEVRYKVDGNIINKIRQISRVLENLERQVDLTLGFDGFNSLNKYGYVCRVRQKSDKIWMEIKTRMRDNTFIETEVNIEEFSCGVSFFEALGMKPYLYMNRSREILEYKGLKIFIDDIELLGKFVEIEYQDIENYKAILDEFLKLVGINSKEQPLYGDIFKNLIEKNNSFKNEFENKLKEFLENK